MGTELSLFPGSRAQITGGLSHLSPLPGGEAMSTHRIPAQSGHCPQSPSPQPFSSPSPQEPPINWHFKAKNNLPPGSLSIHGNRLQPFPAMSDTHALTSPSERTPLLPQGGLGPTLVPWMPRPDTSKTAYWVWGGGVKETQPIPSHQRRLSISGASKGIAPQGWESLCPLRGPPLLPILPAQAP